MKWMTMTHYNTRYLAGWGSSGASNRGQFGPWRLTPVNNIPWQHWLFGMAAHIATSHILQWETQPQCCQHGQPPNYGPLCRLLYLDTSTCLPTFDHRWGNWKPNRAVVVWFIGVYRLSNSQGQIKAVKWWWWNQFSGGGNRSTQSKPPTYGRPYWHESSQCHLSKMHWSCKWMENTDVISEIMEGCELGCEVFSWNGPLGKTAENYGGFPKKLRIVGNTAIFSDDR